MFRKVVDNNKRDYMRAHKSDKPRIAARVVQIIRHLDPPGRFLAPIREADRNSKTKDCTIIWQDVGDKKARAKASQCLREKKQDDTKVSKLGTRTPDTFHFCSQPLRNDANLVSSKKYPRSFDSVDECNLPDRCGHFAPERGYHCYTQEKHNHYPNYHKYSYHPQSSYHRESHPETKYTHQDFASHDEPVTSTSHANSVTPTDKKYSLSFAHENKVNRECDPKSWLGSFHSLESHMMDSSMSFASPIISEHVNNIPSWTWKDCTVPSFVRSTSPTMSELTFLSTNGDEGRH